MEGENAEGKRETSQEISNMPCLASSPPPPTNYLKIMVSYLKELGEKFIRQKNEISEERRNALLVIASLLMTITYRLILSPPGGLWQDSSVGYRNFYPSTIFIISNSVTFVLSYITILLLIPASFLYFILRLALLFLFACYFSALVVIIPTEDWMRNSVLCVVLFSALVGLYFSITRKIWGWLGDLLMHSCGWLGTLVIRSWRWLVAVQQVICSISFLNIM
jgi:hypothetical protein